MLIMDTRQNVHFLVSLPAFFFLGETKFCFSTIWKQKHLPIMAAEAHYTLKSDERHLLGGFLLFLALLAFVVLYVLDMAGFTIFLLLVAAGVVLGMPQHKNLMRLEGRSVLITGCDTGFGHELAKRLAQNGATVFAGCLRADGEGARALREVKVGAERLHVVPMDVTSDESVKKAVDYVQEKSGDLWAVVNNAGINYLGDADIVSMEAFKRVGEVNLYGMVRTAKACLPLLKKSKGRVINVTSVKGIMAFPLCSHYNMTKFAGEAFSDCLRMEMKRFGVHVVLIEPCNFGGLSAALLLADRDYNDIWDKMSPELKAEYGREYIDAQIEGAKGSAKSTCPTMDPVLEAIQDSLRAERPQYRYHIGGGQSSYDFYKWLALLRPYIPTNLMDSYVLRLFNLPTPKVLQEK